MPQNNSDKMSISERRTLNRIDVKRSDDNLSPSTNIVYSTAVQGDHTYNLVSKTKTWARNV